MKRLALPAAVLCVVCPWLTGAGPRAPGPNQVKLNGHVFTLPPGFTVELAAGPPLVNRPIVADFDEEGRLYVADSSGSNEKVEVQLKKKPHRIVRLEDRDGDGHFDKSVVFADKMMFPEGTMWHAGSLYVSAPPSIWKLTDTDGDGKADVRVEWFKGKTLTGCANDLHGPYLGPDGWVYWCKGAFAKQTYERPGKPPLVTRASHIFRCRPDGTGVEPVLTGGMDNPVDVVFTPGGERILSTTFFQHPGGGQRDGLIHAVYGGIYGKDHDVIYDPSHKWTGPAVMPVLTHHGPSATCGLVRYSSEAFGPEYRDNLFAALFNMQKVTRHVLVPDGSTFRTRDQDFLVSDNRDFHPTDVIEDADGSLLVVDTGGWYKLCCPTSQLHKPDVLGAIYRVRKKDAPRVDDPRGLKLPWKKLSARELARLLDDPRPAVRRRAVEALAGKGAVEELGKVIRAGRSARARRNGVWSATRVDREEARAAVRRALADPDESVRQSALHSVSLWRDRKAVGQLLKLLKGRSPHNRRGAAEALGRIGEKSAVPELLGALGGPADRVLEHSLTYALIEIGDREGTKKGLEGRNLRTRRAALIALDQMEGGGLRPGTVLEAMASSDARLREAGWWLAGRHPEWGNHLAGFLRERLGAKGMSAAGCEELTAQLARSAHSPKVRALLADLLGKDSTPAEARRIVLRAMARAHPNPVPPAWVGALTKAVGGGDRAVVREGVATARALPLTGKGAEKLSTALVRKLSAALVRIGTDAKAPADLRLGALSAVPGGLGEVSPELFDFLKRGLDAEGPVTTRALAANVLARARLGKGQLLALAGEVKQVGPMELDRVLEAFGRSTDEKVGLALVEALKSSPARGGLRLPALKQYLAKYPPGVRKKAEGLYALLNADEAKQRAKLEKLLATLKGGDVRRGQGVFNSAKAACSSCHAIGYLGGKVGPDLTHVGQVRSERDILEAIVFPSASFVRSYEPWEVTTRRGRTYTGVLKQNAPEEVVLATSATEEVRVARKDIEEMVPGKVSIMPAGLDQQLTPQELADLVAFLKACK